MPGATICSVSHRFFLIDQKELAPNQPNKSAKAAARSRRPAALCRVHSRQKARAPTAANAKKTNPVTSSHNWPRARLQRDAVMRPACMTAPNVRVFRTWRPATRAAMPNFRPVERGDIVIDFTKLPGYNNAARVVFPDEPAAAWLHLISSKAREPGGVCGPGTQAADEGTRGSDQ
jgi:hypothetical protein